MRTLRRYFGLVLAPAMLALAVAACGPLPRPFKPEAAAPPNALVAEVVTAGVWIAPIEGVSLPMSQLLVDSVADGLRKNGIKIVKDEPTTSRYQLRGRAELNSIDPSFDNVALIHWTLVGVDGKVIGAETQGVGGDREEWDYGSPKIIQDVGANVPAFIADAITKDEDTLKAVRPRIAGMWVNPIRDAPGDGGRSLTRAIEASIERAGMSVASDRRHAEFVLDGRVRVDPPAKGLQRVEIVWAVQTPDGREIGRATQKNMVEAGTFDRQWGEVADVVAEAALGGIQGVLRAAGAYGVRLGQPMRVLNTDFPAAVGMAPLPPPRLDLEGVAAPRKKPGNPASALSPPG